jgi:hypothetical protein
MNKSQAVRDYLASHPDAGPNAIREALAEKGIAISTSLASVIKYGSNKKKKGKPGRPKGSGRGARAGRSASGLNIEALVDAKRMAERMGGIDAARTALDLLAKLS